jgi:putative transposase
MVSPFKIELIQTDNGLEFEKYFREYIKKVKIVHYHNYPRCPKMNAYIERFNRTIQEEFINKNLSQIRYDMAIFNQKLMDYLIWYNTKRPYWSLNLISPVKYLINNCGFFNMCWASRNI